VNLNGLPQGGPQDENWKLRALECASEGIVITDALQPDNPIVYVNQGFRTITGYKDSDVLGKNCRFMRGQETAEKTTENIREALRSGQPFSSEIVNYRKNGDRFWNQLHISPVRDASKRITHFVGIQLDVTRLKEAEKELEQSRERLAIAESFRSVSEMAAGVAHEINNPMCVIYHRARQALRLLKEKEHGKLSEADRQELKVGLESIETMGARVSAIVREMQVFTSASKGSPREVIALGNLVDSAVAMHRTAAKILSINVTKAFSPDIAVEANALQLEHVFSNLLANAIDAVTSLESREITVTAQQLGDRVEIRIRDSGPRISDDIAGRVFMPFFTTKDPGKGTGLGLAIARSFAEQNSGELSLERDVRGNTFLLSLPKAKNQGASHNS